MKFLKKDERGASLVMVLISMTFLTMIAMAILAMTMNNIRLKATQRGTEKNFYETDACLDTIVAGIQNDSSEYSANAYSSALVEYSASINGTSSTNLQDNYKQTFLKNISMRLSGLSDSDYDLAVDAMNLAGNSSFTIKYQDDIIDEYLDASGFKKDGSGNYVVDSNNHFSSTYIGHKDTTGEGDMVVTKDQGVVLKNVRVRQTKDGYDTMITTDICIDIPEISAQTESEFMDYAILADNQIKSAIGGNSTLNIIGSVYAGTVSQWSGTDDEAVGILASGNTTLNIMGENVITRGNIMSEKGGNLDIRGTTASSGQANVWTENIKTDSDVDGITRTTLKTENSIEITGNIHVADDTELGGVEDVIKLAGNYYGFNYREDYTDDGSGTNLIPSKTAYYNSAMIVNGRDNSLDVSGLNVLVLGGRTFISKKANKGATEADVASNPEVELGESLTVKSNQLAYYVPSDFSGAENNYTGATGVNRTDGKIYFKYNNTDPNAQMYFFDYKGYNKYIGVNNFDVLDYVDNAKPLLMYHRNDAEAGGEIIYFYLNFQDEQKSAAFYDIFYNKSDQQDILDPVNKAYLKDPGIKVNDSTIFCTSGNILYSDGSDLKLRKGLKVSLGAEGANADAALLAWAQSDSREYMARQLSLLGDYVKVKENPTLWRLPQDSTKDLSKSGLKDHTNLFDTLVNRTELTSRYSTVTENAVATTGGKNCVAVLGDGDYDWTSSRASALGTNQGIIIVTGNVSVKANFEGIIIAGGDVTLDASGITVKADAEMLQDLFETDDSLATPQFYDLLSKYFRKSLDATISGSDSSDPDSQDAVYFQNWKKNEE